MRIQPKHVSAADDEDIYDDGISVAAEVKASQGGQRAVGGDTSSGACASPGPFSEDEYETMDVTQSKHNVAGLLNKMLDIQTSPGGKQLEARHRLDTRPAESIELLPPVKPPKPSKSQAGISTAHTAVMNDYVKNPVSSRTIAATATAASDHINLQGGDDGSLQEDMDDDVDNI